MKNILIVDDSLFMRNYLKDILAKNLFSRNYINIVEADGRKNALLKMKSNTFDVILLDIVMKESDVEGVEFLTEIYKLFLNQKVIVISSVGQPYIINKCKQLGVKHFLQKPFEPEKIIESIKAVLQ